MAQASGAQINHEQGIEFVSVGAVGNAPWAGNGYINDRAIGRGAVNYEYRVGRFEVSTAVWVEFFNAAYSRPASERLPHLLPPTFWGAQVDYSYTGPGQRWMVPAGNENIPVGGVSWRMAAMFCNWMQGGKTTERASFLSGAYDVSTFGYTPGATFTDQAARSPGARFFIPTWDELLKATHYDPNRNGDGAGGWWLYNNGTELPLRAGPPGFGDANYGWNYNGLQWSVPLGAYPTVQTPWGLLDAAGGTEEWTESIRRLGFNQPERILIGSYWGSSIGASIGDAIYGGATQFPDVFGLDYGFRIAAVIPSPPGLVVLGGFVGLMGIRRRPRPTPSTVSALGMAVLLATGSGSALAQSSIPLSPTAQAAGAHITTEQGIDFVTIGSPGNAPWPGNGTIQDHAIGRGGVNYEYRIGRFEVTTAQWTEFFNAAYARPSTDTIPFLPIPSHWGAVADSTYHGPGRRWVVPEGNEMRPVGNIDWRMAAIFCNWLTNDKRLDREAFMSGAYDVSTFGYQGADVFTDQAARSQGARFFIPTWDEWLKAAHYDPNRFGAGQGGWWEYSNTSNTMLVGGPPPSMGGNGQANYGWGDALSSQYRVLLGAYPETQTPWGLLDAAGGTREWTESIVRVSVLPPNRILEGSFWSSAPGYGVSDAMWSQGADYPSYSEVGSGFRIAAVIPAPGGLVVLGALCLSLNRRRRQ